MTADLHSRIATEIDRRLAVARAATEAKPGQWISLDLQPSAFGADPPTPAATAQHIAMADPADSIRRLEAASRVLNRHARYIIPAPYRLAGKPNCHVCNGHTWPCLEILDLAASLGLDTEGSTTDG